MALVPIISQSWDTTSVFNPTRMNNIENNIAIAATAEGTEYSNGVSVKDKIDSMETASTVTISTVNEHITIARQYCAKIGKLFYYNIAFTTDNNGASGDILGGFPTPSGGIHDNGVLFIGQTTIHPIYINGNMILRNPLSANGTFVISGCYITN